MLKNHMSTCKKTHVNMQHLFLILARFPWLLPVRNSFASYGASAVARTSDRGHVAEAKTKVIEVAGSQSGFPRKPFSPLMSTCTVSSKHKDAEHRPLVVWMID